MREGWTQVAIGDVAEASWGNTSITKKSYKPSGYLAYSAAGPDGHLDFYEHDGPGVVISAIGTVGRSWLANGKWTSIKNTIWMKGRPDVALTEFLFLLVSTPDFWPIRGQAQSFISLGDVRKREVFLPPLSEQARIVDMVDSVDAYIAGLEKQVEAARTARNAVVHELLSAGGDGWREMSLGDLVELIPGKYLPKSEYEDDGAYFVYGSNSVMGKYSKALIDGPHVVMAAIGAYAGAVRFSTEPSWVNNNAFGLVCRDKIEPFYLHLWLSSQLAVEQVVAGTGQPYVQRPALKAVRIHVPPMEEQQRIVEVVESMDEMVCASESSLAKARQFREGLLSDLLSGNHEIPESYDKVLGAA